MQEEKTSSSWFIHAIIRAIGKIRGEMDGWLWLTGEFSSEMPKLNQFRQKQKSPEAKFASRPC